MLFVHIIYKNRIAEKQDIHYFSFAPGDYQMFLNHLFSDS